MRFFPTIEIKLIDEELELAEGMLNVIFWLLIRTLAAVIC
jgi:hypothetical protein